MITKVSLPESNDFITSSCVPRKESRPKCSCNNCCKFILPLPFERDALVFLTETVPEPDDFRLVFYFEDVVAIEHLDFHHR